MMVGEINGAVSPYVRERYFSRQKKYLWRGGKYSSNEWPTNVYPIHINITRYLAVTLQERNPFFLPHNLDHVILNTLGQEHTPLGEQEQLDGLRTGDLAVILKVNDPIYLNRLEKAMKIIVYEESLYGRARVSLQTEMMMNRVEATTAQRKQTHNRHSLRPVESPTAKKRLTIYDECHTMSNDYTQLQRNVLHLKKMANVFNNRLKQLDREVRLIVRSH